MSTNLFFRPLNPKEGACLSKSLKFALSRYVWKHDGSLSGESQILDNTDIPFLNGVIAGTPYEECKQDAQKLIDAIEKYDDIEVWVE